MSRIDPFIGPLFVVAALFAATTAQIAHAVEVRIPDFTFGCEAPDGKRLKPKFGDVPGLVYADIRGNRQACRDAIQNKITLCGVNVDFASNTENRRYDGCLPVFREQAKSCAAHFTQEMSRCGDGGSAPGTQGGATSDPWSADGGAAHDSWGDDSAAAEDPWGPREPVSVPSPRNEAPPAPASAFAGTDGSASPGYDSDDAGGRDGYDDSLATLDRLEEEQRLKAKEEERREAQRILEQDAEQRRAALQRQEREEREAEPIESADQQGTSSTRDMGWSLREIEGRPSCFIWMLCGLPSGTITWSGDCVQDPAHEPGLHIAHGHGHYTYRDEECTGSYTGVIEQGNMMNPTIGNNIYCC